MGSLQRYDDADASGPLMYFGYVGYEHSGRLFSPAVTVIDIRGATPRSTQSKSRLRRSHVLGIGAAASVFPSPLVPKFVPLKPWPVWGITKNRAKRSVCDRPILSMTDW